MLRFKFERNKDIINEGYNQSYLTEVAFYIGTKKYISDEINEKLINKVNIDGMVAFYFYIKYLVNNFEMCDCDDVYEYVDEYYSQDLDEFIKKYFVEEM